MRLWRRRITAPVHVPAAVPPTYTSLDDFIGHALRYPQNGWYEPLGLGTVDSVGTVSRCLQLNSQAVASMPMRYRHSPSTIGYEPAWIHDPDPAWYPNGIGDAIFAAVWSIYAHGDTFLWVTSRYESGYPRTWTVLDPVTMKVRDAGGYRSYESNKAPLDSRDVLQVSRNPTGGLRGTSALEAYAGNVASAYAAERYAADVYQSTGVNRVALQTSQRLNKEQARALQGEWVEAVQMRLGAPAVLPPDITMLDPLSIPPRDMMLLETRDWDARQIAAAFGVPAILLNIAVTGGLTYQNPEQLFGLWWRSELMPCALKIGAALSRWLPRGHWVEFDPSMSVRPDLDQLVNIYSRALADQVITADEYRAAVFDLPPLVEGEDEALTFFEEPGAHGAEGAPPTVQEVLA